MNKARVTTLRFTEPNYQSDVIEKSLGKATLVLGVKDKPRRKNMQPLPGVTRLCS